MYSTIRIDTDQIDDINELILKQVKLGKIESYHIQLETADETGKLHIQGYLFHRWTDQHYKTKSPIALWCKKNGIEKSQKSFAVVKELSKYLSYIHNHPNKSNLIHYNKLSSNILEEIKSVPVWEVKKTLKKNNLNKSVSFQKRLYDDISESCIITNEHGERIINYSIIFTKVYNYAGQFFKNMDRLVLRRCIFGFTASLEYHINGTNPHNRSHFDEEKRAFEEDNPVYVGNLRHWEKMFN